MSDTLEEQYDEGVAYWLLGAAQERQTILSYLRDVLNNIREVDSPTGAAQATIKTIILEIEEDVHHEGGLAK
jgi:hypothetical protein